MQRKEKEGRKKLKYDSNDGLLPEIRRICGYPEHKSEELSPRGSGKKKKQVEEEWKWPEAQICGLCSIGGDILCCERCPASFHLACIGYESSDLPDDSFYCNRCKNMPENVRLFPPEKCSPTANPLHRVENENRRNWEAIEYQCNRLREEALAEKMMAEVPYGPLKEFPQMQQFFRDKCVLKALGMANPMDYTLPPQYQLDREFYPGDTMEEKRPSICAEVCAECQLKDDWSPMLNCDFCNLRWHQKCVIPPLINIPRLIYWMCPRHPESVIDSVFLGEKLTRERRRELYDRYGSIAPSFELFEKFCQATEKFRLEAEICSGSTTANMYYAPEAEIPFFMSSILIPKAYRKGGRGRKKNESRFFNNSFLLQETFGEETGSNKRNTRTYPDLMERRDAELDKLDGKRSKKFTDEELLSSLISFDEASRADYLSQKLLSTDLEMATNFFNRHSSMIARVRAFYQNFSEKDIIKLMRRDLDPVETVRGGGVQSICSMPEKTYRKKLKADVELLIQLIGFGNDHSNRKINTARSEAFFRRCVPPLKAQDVLNQRTLRETALNSQREAFEMSNVYKYHSFDGGAENLVLLAYDNSFDSAEERDSYFVSSMTIWSKEPIYALTEKWVFENRTLRLKSETPVDCAPEVPNVVYTAESMDDKSEAFCLESSAASNASPISPALVNDQNNEETTKPFTPIDSDLTSSSPERIESDSLSRAQRESSTSSILYSNDIGPVEFVNGHTNDEKEKVDLFDFTGLEMIDVYEKAETVYEAEGFFGENDEMPSDMRRTKSETDIVDRVIWPLVRSNLQNFLRRESFHQTHHEHNYFSLYPSNYLEDSDITESPNSFPLVCQTQNNEDGDEKSIYSTEFLSPTAPHSEYYENFVDVPVVRKRGRPLGSRNRKDGEAIPKKKRDSAGSSTTGRGRGRGGRPRGSRRVRGRGGSVTGSLNGGGASRRQSSISTDTPESPEQDSVSISKKLLNEVEEIRLKYAKMMITRSLEEAKHDYFETRDDALEKWTAEQWQNLKERCLAGRRSSLIPYEPRFFLPTQRVLAHILVNDQHLPVAIQRCLTKLGTSRDCHIRIDKYTDSFCSAISEYHCDIIRDYHSDTFYLSTLGTETAIVNGIAVRRPRLTASEAAEQSRTQGASSSISQNLKCQCQKVIDQLVSHQENNGELVQCGIIKLEDGSRVQVGCVSFTFRKS